MRIVIDMQGAQAENKNRGIGRYSLALTKGIVRNRGQHEIILALNGAFADTIEPIRAALQDDLPQTCIHVWKPVVPASHIETENDWRRSASEKLYEAFLKSLKPDALVITSLFEGLGQDAVTSIGQLYDMPVAVVLYDLIPLINPSPYLDNQAVKRWYEEKVDFIRKANLLLSISESSRQEALEYLQFQADSVVNISTDADPQFFVRHYSDVEVTNLYQKYGIQKSLVLYTGGIDHRKNIEGLISAYSRLPFSLRAQHQLAIVCSVSESDKMRLQNLACAEGMKPHELLLTGFVPENHLIALYNLCKVFVFPSWHEGFGLPALEAMRCGAPVIGSDSSSLPEVIGLQEALFDPRDIQSITGKLEKVLTDELFRGRLKNHAIEYGRNFSWDKTAVNALAALESRFVKTISSATYAGCRKVKVSDKPKMAYVSPLPPERSGISDYSAELLPELSRYYNVDVVVAQKEVSDSWVLESCKIMNSEQFRAQYKQYDRVIYHFGNSHFHAHMFDLIEEIPGVVVLHDFYISGAVAYIESSGCKPLYFLKELYQEYGYPAIEHYFHRDGVAWEYPCNRIPLEYSTGVIVHSEFSRRLAETWHGREIAENWKVIPHLRVSSQVNKEEARKARKSLGVPEDAFLICSFGLLGPTKLNDRLLAAWLKSSLANDEKCFLVFVGENDESEFGEKLKQNIEHSGCCERIRITGWADHDTFKGYLAAADVGVQLRGQTRGETSGTILDCMNYGLATIVNSNGSMSDLSADVVWKLEDQFEQVSLINALETLYEDDEFRKDLGHKARSEIINKHSPQQCGLMYADAVECFYSQCQANMVEPLADSIFDDALSSKPSDSDLRQLSSAIDAAISEKLAKPQLLVDISELVQRDARSGIQRVVKSILKEWLINPPDGYRVEPVYATCERPGFYYARQFSLDFLNCPSHVLDDEPVIYRNGDVFLGLDLNFFVAHAQKDYIADMRRSGVYVSYVVYDLLPIHFPEFWEPQHNVKKLYQDWLEVVTSYDSVLCISRAVADELKAWLKEQEEPRERPLKVDWFHLGVDAENSNPSKGMPSNAEQVLNKINKKHSFLMVGTLEPRKGHKEVLETFDQLWSQGQDLNLIIVGKRGWLVDELIAKICHHPQLNQRLFWLEGISDEYLEKVYQASDCLIAASYGEGFGLPLIEAAHYKLPIIARDIPVFREVAGDCALYFDGSNEPASLKKTIVHWLGLFRKKQHPSSVELNWLTWDESADNLWHAIIKGVGYGGI